MADDWKSVELTKEEKGDVRMGAGGEALGMAATGASIGTTIMPGVGTAIGAGIGLVAGALYGGIAGKKQAKQAKSLAEKAEKAQTSASRAAQKAAHRRSRSKMDSTDLALAGSMGGISEAGGPPGAYDAWHQTIYG